MSFPKKIKRLGKKLRWAMKNRQAAARIRKEIVLEKKPIADITRFERKIYSQNGEDGIFEALFAAIGSTNRYFVEFGTGSGKQCNTAHLAKHHGWTGLMMDAQAGVSRSGIPIRGEFITAENIENLFRKYEVPSEFDLLSIDIDGNDYWVWKAITRYHPRVVVIEYNASVPPDQSLVIPYDPKFQWGGTDFFGAGVGALKKLGDQKGYQLVGCDNSGTNCFFVQRSLIAEHFSPAEISKLYRRPAYRNGKGHPPEPSRKMISV